MISRLARRDNQPPTVAMEGLLGATQAKLISTVMTYPIMIRRTAPPEYLRMMAWKHHTMKLLNECQETIHFSHADFSAWINLGSIRRIFEQ